MMNQAKPCDQSKIDDYLTDRLEDEQRESFAAHLEECDACRQALSDEAAEPEFWNQAAGLLGPAAQADVPTIDRGMMDEMHPATAVSVDSILRMLAPTDDPEMLGRVGEYEISGVVGFGGMGAVLKGFDPSLLRVVAIKVMAPHLADKGSARVRFEREARAAAAISHANVIEIYRVAELNGLPYLVMPYARGPSLQRRIDESGPLSTLEVIHVGRQVASGLAAAHEQGLVHRDIKPANILLNDAVERLLITDFGVARAMDDASMTQTGLIAGTPQYMSPEQSRGEMVDQRSDLFSLGALLYTVCTGRPPFRADTPFAVLRKITDSAPRPVRELNPDIPEWLEKIIHRLLEKDMTDRFENAAEVAELFEKCLAHLQRPTQVNLPPTIKTMRAPRPLNQLAKPASKRKTYLGIGIIMSAVALVTLSFALVFQLTQAPEIGGQWQGEAWQDIELSSVTEAEDWYSGTFVDRDGKKGAIHLEWSTLRQRYVGRWSIGDGDSGSIVLREQGSSVVGAIAMDSNVSDSGNDLRLRDFIWQKNSQPRPGRTYADNARRITGQSATSLLGNSHRRVIKSPQEGTVTAIGPKLIEGAQIKKGDLIVEIGNLNISVIEQKIKESKNMLKATEYGVNAYQENIKALIDAKNYTVESASEMAAAAEAKYRGSIAKIEAHEAKTRQAQLNYERARKLSQKGLQDKEAVEDSKIAWELAQAELASAAASTENLEKEWNIRKLDVEQSRKSAESKVRAAEAALKNAQSEVANLQKDINDLEIKRETLQKIRIHAPVDGVIMKISVIEEGESIREGEQIIVIAAESSDRGKTAPSKSAPTMTTGPGSTVPSSNQFSNAAMLQLASDLEQRINDGRSKIADHEDAIASFEEQFFSHQTNLADAQDQLESSSDLDKKTKAVLQQKVNLSKQMLSAIENSLEDLKKSKTHEMGTFNSAQSDLEAAMTSLRVMYDSEKQSFENARKLAELAKLQYEEGDSTIIEWQESKSRVEQAEGRIRLLENLIDRFDKIVQQKSER